MTALLEADGLQKTFLSRGRTVHAVSDVTLAVHAGGALGIVGESGCGKTTTARMLLRLEEPSAGQASGSPAPTSPPSAARPSVRSAPRRSWSSKTRSRR